MNKLRKHANRRGFILSCDHLACQRPIMPGQRYYLDEVTRQTFCTAGCAKAEDQAMQDQGLARFDPVVTA